MAQARIFQPSRNAMQSGKAKSRHWVLEFEAASVRSSEPLMGWTSSSDTAQQVKLKFDSRELAEAYAKRHDISYRLVLPHKAGRRQKSYADNFRWGREQNWTH